jgi:hypothetical protein
MKKCLHQGVKRLHLQIHPLFIKIRLGFVEKLSPFLPYYLMADKKEEKGDKK